MKQSIISMDNALINAAQGLLLSEKRILMLALTKLTNVNKSNLDIPIKLLAIDFSELYNIEKNSAYEQIKNACESIIKKQVSWHEEKNNSINKIQINWVSSAEYSPKNGFVEISFTQKIQKYITNLTKHFTTYQLQQAKGLRSVYSWRLLELLSQFKKTGWREIELNQFILSMEAKNSHKKKFYEIRRKIIEPSIKELKEKDKWEIDWNPIKTGRKITGLYFKFKKN